MRDLTKGELNDEIDRYLAGARANIEYARSSLKDGLHDPNDLENAIIHIVDAEAALAVADNLMRVSVLARLGPVSQARERRYDSMQVSVRKLLTRIVRSAKSIDW